MGCSIALQVLTVHQRPLCIQSVTPKLLTHKRPHAQLRWVGPATGGYVERFFSRTTQ